MFTSVLALISFAPILVLATTCNRDYTVQTGDFCDLISGANNASTYQLAIVNSGTVNADCTNLEVGQLLCLGTSDGDCKTTYIVQNGDFCDAITEKFNINSTILSHNNPQIDAACSNIYPGEVLCVANQVLVPAVTGNSPPPSSIHPSTPAPATTSPPTNVEASPSDDGDDDDDNLPFCDEL